MEQLTFEMSRKAKERIKPHAPTQRQKVLDCIRLLGPMTDEQIQDALDMSASSERPRRGELQKAGLIEIAGEGLTKSGRKAVKWKETK